MSERPRKMSPPATLVIWAARELTLGEKVVWYRDWTLDTWPNGSYAGPKAIAASLGQSVKPDSVAAIRRHLKRLGLYYVVDRGAGVNQGWVSTLPAEFRPRASREAAGLAVMLDAYIRRFALGPSPCIQEEPTPAPRTTPPLYENEGAEAAASVGGRGAHFSVSESEAQLPSEVREKGVGATAPKGEKRRAALDDIERPMNESERAAFDAMLATMPPKQAAMLRRIAKVA